MSTIQTLVMLMFMTVVACMAVMLVLAGVVFAVVGMVGQAIVAVGLAVVIVAGGYKVASWADENERRV